MISDSAIASIVTGVVAIVTLYYKSDKVENKVTDVKGKVAEYHAEVNGKMDALLEAKKNEGKLEAIQEAKKEEKNNTSNT